MIVSIVTIAGVALISGCTDSPRRVDGQAAPVGGAKSGPSASSASSPSPSLAPSSAPPSSSSSPSSRPSASSTSPSRALVLGPAGLGRLKIGMSLQAAQATGELTNVQGTGGGCGSAVVKAARSDAAVVIWSSTKGLVSIPAYGRIATPEGARVGSTTDQVQKVHRDFTVRDTADGWVDGTGTGYSGFNDEYKNVHYRFAFKNDKVVEMWLEHDTQNCYE
ncbi:hypothetical protein [Actinoplanes subglobosus]|uniref:Lipoprotein n=1 Tax=Actinoplanes subglobosus TaxID=1547892 RepID=A0ABV8IL61_9ACTN